MLEVLRRERRTEHEAATGRWIGERIAQVLGYDYGGVHPQSCDDARVAPFYVPDRTLLLDDAKGLGIGGPEQLLGGVVPHGFVATKSITHPLVADAEHVPDGWAHGLGDALADVTLPGYTAFGRGDALRAGQALLAQGFPLRIKPGDGVGGLGQAMATNAKALDAVLASLHWDSVRHAGVVIELNLKPVKTYSIGALQLGVHRVACFGMQFLARNHKDQHVYGGSTLTCVRGGLEDLMALLDDPAERRVLDCGIRYDAEVSRAYPEFFASRRNYDVALGVDPSGMPRTGVLEQSWRIGGATPAEVLALQALHLDDRLPRIRVSTHEVYADVEPPMGAQTYFRGNDPHAGQMTKYATVDVQDDLHGR